MGIENKDIFTETPHPNALDIIKIDGRWAQSFGPRLIRFLDDGSEASINWDDYERVRSFGGTSINLLEQLFGESLTEDEISCVRWGPEEKEHPHLKKFVEVFGEYNKKKK